MCACWQALEKLVIYRMSIWHRQPTGDAGCQGRQLPTMMILCMHQQAAATDFTTSPGFAMCRWTSSACPFLLSSVVTTCLCVGRRPEQVPAASQSGRARSASRRVLLCKLAQRCNDVLVPLLGLYEVQQALPRVTWGSAAGEATPGLAIHNSAAARHR